MVLKDINNVPVIDTADAVIAADSGWYRDKNGHEIRHFTLIRAERLEQDQPPPSKKKKPGPKTGAVAAAAAAAAAKDAEGVSSAPSPIPAEPPIPPARVEPVVSGPTASAPGTGPTVHARTHTFRG